MHSDTIVQLLSAGTINNLTLVWRTGMGDWAPVQQTELSSLLTMHGMTPPPVVGGQVNNPVVWTLAFVPIASVFVQMYLAGALDVTVGSLWFVAVIMNIALSLADSSILQKAGYDTKGLSSWIFLVPVYLFARASKLKQSNGYAIVWLACFVISLFLL